MSRLVHALSFTAATAIVGGGLYLVLGKAAPIVEHRQEPPAPAPTALEAPASPTSPRIERQPTEAPSAIYRCSEGGATVYSDTPCKNGRIVDVQSTQGFEGRRLAQQAATIPPSTVERASATPTPATTGGSSQASCESIDKAIASIDAAARAGGTIAYMEYLKEERRKLVERRQALGC